MNTEVIDVVIDAKAAVQRAFEVLTWEGRGEDIYLPAEDLKIALRFLELARGGLVKMSARNC